MNGVAPAQATVLTGPTLDNKRVLAGLIDLAVLLLFGFLLGAIAGSWTPGAVAVIVGWSLYYYFALELLTGQTVGKKVMGLKVARADGGEPDMRAIAIRTVLRLVDGVGGYLVGLIVMLATGERRQRLGDLAADTVVTVAEESPADSSPASQPERAPQPAPMPDPLPGIAPAADGPPPVPEVRPFEPFAAPEEPVAPEPEPVPDAEPHVHAVPSPPPAEEPGEDESPAENGEAPRMQIVSPIDLVMGEDEERPGGDGHVPPPGDAAA